MINKHIVYKIKYIPLSLEGKTHLLCDGKSMKGYGSDTEWVIGCNVIPKIGGSGKTFTSKTIVNRMFTDIKKLSGYGSQFKCEIVTFRLDEIESSDSII